MNYPALMTLTNPIAVNVAPGAFSVSSFWIILEEPEPAHGSLLSVKIIGSVGGDGNLIEFDTPAVTLVAEQLVASYTTAPEQSRIIQPKLAYPSLVQG